MHFAHAFTRLCDPFTTARTRWMFGFQRRLARLCEKETRLPKPGVLPQMSQTAAIADRWYQPFRDAPDARQRTVASAARSCSSVIGPDRANVWVPFAS
jgi:hypothetical protein